MRCRLLLASTLLFLAASFAGTSSAQVQWQLGFKGGLNLGKVTGDTEFSDSFTDPGVGEVEFDGDIDGFRKGFVGGAFATAQVNPRFGVRVEALYAQKGGKGEFDVTVDGSPFGTGDAGYKFDYFEIPILAVGSFPMGETTSFDIFAGPAIAFNMGADGVVELEGEEAEEDFSDEVKGTDFGIAFGAGVTISANETMNVVIDGRYTLGLSEVPEDGDGLSLKNQSLAFMAGLSFAIGQGSSGP